MVLPEYFGASPGLLHSAHRNRNSRRPRRPRLPPPTDWVRLNRTASAMTRRRSFTFNPGVRC